MKVDERILEAAARAAYETWTEDMMGAHGPPQHALVRTPWENALPFVKDLWRRSSGAAISVVERAQQAEPKVEPIDLAPRPPPKLLPAKS